LINLIKNDYEHIVNSIIYILNDFCFLNLFLRVYKRYRAICPEVVPKKMTGDEPVKIRVPQERIEQLPELKV